MWDGDLTWIMAIVQLCQQAVATGKTLVSWIPEQLDERERELLIAASHDGLIYLGENDRDGRHVMVHGILYTSPQDAATAAYYVDAFVSLCNRGIIMDQPGSGNKFRLTGKGFDLARGLAERAKA